MISSASPLSSRQKLLTLPEPSLLSNAPVLLQEDQTVLLLALLLTAAVLFHPTLSLPNVYNIYTECRRNVPPAKSLEMRVLVTMVLSKMPLPSSPKPLALAPATLPNSSHSYLPSSLQLKLTTACLLHPLLTSSPPNSALCQILHLVKTAWNTATCAFLTLSAKSSPKCSAIALKRKMSLQNGKQLPPSLFIRRETHPTLATSDPSP